MGKNEQTYSDTMVSQHLLDLPTLDTDPCLPHHLRRLAYPDHDYELYACALGVICVLDADVGILCFGGFEVCLESSRGALAGWR